MRNTKRSKSYKKWNIECFILVVEIGYLFLNHFFSWIDTSSSLHRIIYFIPAFILLISNIGVICSKKNMKFFFLMLLLIFSGLIVHLVTKTSSYTIALRIIADFGIAVSLIKNRDHAFIKNALSSICLITCLYYFYLFSAGVVSKVYLLEMGYKYSKNHVSTYSTYALLLFSILNSVDKPKKKRWLLLMIVLNIFIAIWANTRSGIISAFVGLFLFVILTLVKKDKLRKSLTVAILCIGLICIIFDTQLLSIVKKYFEQFAVFSVKGFEDSARQSIITSYIKGTNLMNFIFGGNESWVGVNDVFTVHNSYLMLHIRFGLASFVLIFYLLQTVFRLIGKKELYTIGITLFVVLLRAVTDSIMLSNFDYITYACIFLTIQTYDKSRSRGYCISSGEANIQQ